MRTAQAKDGYDWAALHGTADHGWQDRCTTEADMSPAQVSDAWSD